MLVPGLEKSSLSTMISGDNTDYPCLHNVLYQCGQDILAKYKQKQEGSEKLVVKTRAVKALLEGLGDASENPCATHITILAALESHAAALQCHEHLLSEKGNNYALMEQTKGLGDGHDKTSKPASLLLYHDLKNKVLVPDKTPAAPAENLDFSGCLP